jgi:hypothetical protein
MINLQQGRVLENKVLENKVLENKIPDEINIGLKWL